jgi:hypothetical protein
MLEDFEIWSYKKYFGFEKLISKNFFQVNFEIFEHQKNNFGVLYQILLGCHINIFQMFWGVSRLILMTSGATSSMFLECFGGSPDYFQ